MNLFICDCIKGLYRVKRLIQSSLASLWALLATELKWKRLLPLQLVICKSCHRLKILRAMTVTRSVHGGCMGVGSGSGPMETAVAATNCGSAQQMTRTCFNITYYIDNNVPV